MTFFRIKNKLIYFLVGLLFLNCHKHKNLPKRFVFLKNIDPSIIEVSRYSTCQNFMGRPINGYLNPHVVCTKKAAKQLKKANDEFKKAGYQLVVYDGYRPQRAVDEFVFWAKNQKDEKNRNYYYPYLKKNEIASQGYIKQKSGHSRGSTLNVTLIKLGQKPKSIVITSKELTDGQTISFLEDNTIDMGSHWDLFHEASWHNSPLIEKSYVEMRNFLRKIMEKNNFEGYEKEWWHYTLRDEPFPDTYFNFVVEP